MITIFTHYTNYIATTIMVSCVVYPQFMSIFNFIIHACYKLKYTRHKEPSPSQGLNLGLPNTM